MKDVRVTWSKQELIDAIEEEKEIKARVLTDCAALREQVALVRRQSADRNIQLQDALATIEELEGKLSEAHDALVIAVRRTR